MAFLEEGRCWPGLAHYSSQGIWIPRDFGALLALLSEVPLAYGSRMTTYALQPDRHTKYIVSTESSSTRKSHQKIRTILGLSCELGMAINQ